MKKIITLIVAAFIIAGVFAQAPDKMSYQTVIRNGSGALVSNHAVGIQISILQGSSSGTAVFVETQSVTTNANGLASLEIGGGTAVTGTVAGIDWSAGPYFIKTETDPAGGTSYSITGTSELLSVPYALNAGNGNWTKTGNNISNANAGYVGIGTTTPASPLEIVKGDFNLAGFKTTGSGDARILFGNSSAYKGTVGWTPFNNSMAITTLLADDISFGSNNLTTEIMHLKAGGNVGIGTSTPAAKLDIAGSIKITDGSEGAGKVLTSDANGLATWSAGVGFRASGTTAGTIASSTNYVIYSTEQYDDGNGYDFSTGVYTVPVTGVYLLTASMEFSTYSGYSSGYVSFGFETSGAVSYDIEETTPNALGNWSLSRSTTMKLTAGTTVKVRLFNGLTGGTLSATGNGNYAEFSAAKLY